jgi:serine/threonine protein kinase HipA of HipAB toxin-antitoxin module
VDSEPPGWLGPGRDAHKGPAPAIPPLVGAVSRAVFGASGSVAVCKHRIVTSEAALRLHTRGDASICVADRMTSTSDQPTS